MSRAAPSVAIPGYEGLYSVDTAGQVISHARLVKSYGTRVYTRPERVLNLLRRKTGYLHVELYRDGVGCWHSVHALVALAFIGPRHKGMQVCHNDGSRDNNVPSNLRYDTPKANQADRRIHGTAGGATGERSGTAKLTEVQVAAIRVDPRSTYAMAADYPVSPQQIARIKRGGNWKGIAA